MKVFTITVLLVISSFFSEAQNLIPDSSFENNKAVPLELSGISQSYSWKSPSRATTDLFCKCKRKKRKISQVNTPHNSMGIQEPRSGKCYAGLFAFSHGDYREYLKTPLKQPLKSNKVYIFSMYISMADYSPSAIDQFGICFLDDRYYDHSNIITDVEPVYIPVGSSIRMDENGWNRVSVTYTAAGGESYLMIGSFDVKKIYRTGLKAPKGVHTHINQVSERDSYYFIDDVSLIEKPQVIKKDSVIKTDTLIVMQVPTDSVIAEKIPNDTVLTVIVPSDTAIVFKNVLFKTDETTLLPSSYPELNMIADYMIKNSDILVEIGGHTDNVGNEKLNQVLSNGRAKTVSEYLIEKGIDKARITYKGYGSSKPIASNETDEGKQQNRRVECTFRKK